MRPVDTLTTVNIVFGKIGIEKSRTLDVLRLVVMSQLISSYEISVLIKPESCQMALL